MSLVIPAGEDMPTSLTQHRELSTYVPVVSPLFVPASCIRSHVLGHSMANDAANVRAFYEKIPKAFGQCSGSLIKGATYLSRRQDID